MGRVRHPRVGVSHYTNIMPVPALKSGAWRRRLRRDPAAPSPGVGAIELAIGAPPVDPNFVRKKGRRWQCQARGFGGATTATLSCVEIKAPVCLHVPRPMLANGEVVRLDGAVRMG